MSKSAGLRDLPSVDQLLNSKTGQDLLAVYGRPLTVEALRAALEAARDEFPNTKSVPDSQTLLKTASQHLVDWTAPTLQPVINASGVIIHTNLGRAPLSPEALEAMQAVARGYSNLEYDLSRGRRGSRLIHAEAILQRLTGAEGALVVNNNAAAVLLILSALARRRRVVIARSQLVEIGGGFRIPDVMRQSNAKLLEVGATNRVHLSDYEEALEEPVALFMRAHRSNFRIVGFTSEPDLVDIAALAHRHGLPMVDDLGSGTLIDTALYGLGHEPMVQESLQSGSDLVSFSGDKLLGGPQAGIIVGRGDLIAKLKKHPLARALRADKLCLAGLSATLGHYLKDEAQSKIPVWRMIAADVDSLQVRAASWMQALGTGEIITGESTVGGGSLPGETLPTRLLALSRRGPKRLLQQLRAGQPPVIARIEDQRVLLDPRTVLPEQEEAFLRVLAQVLAVS